MREIVGNLWDYFGKRDTFICITTNGSIKKDGRAVMGRGCAYEAKVRFPGIDMNLGRKIGAYGNVVHWLEEGLYSFPVKHEWYLRANIELIRASAMRLAEVAEFYHEHVFILPRPGCGNGRLLWAEVKPVIEQILTSDRILVIDKRSDI